MDTFRISRNDPGLAHALAKRELHRINEFNEKMVQRVYRDHKRSLKQSFKALREAYGALVILEGVERPVGSRANGILLVLDNTDDDPEDMTLAAFVFNAKTGGLKSPVRCGVRLKLHTIARTMQRSVGAADIQAVANLLRPHLLHAANYVTFLIKNKSYPPVGTDITIASAVGALCFTVEPGKIAPFTLLARTWVAADMAGDPVLVKAIAKAREIRGCTILTDGNLQLMTLSKKLDVE